MKTLLIFPPQWIPMCPHYAISSLIAQLKYHGFDAHTFDLNIEFFNDILTKDNLEKNIAKIQHSLTETLEYIKKEYSPNKKEDEYSLDFQQKLYKFTKINEYLKTKQSNFQTIPNELENAINVTRSEKFYDPSELINALNVIDEALEIISLNYLPSELSFQNFYNRFMKLTYESIKTFCLDKETNIFYEYYQTKIEDIIAQNNDFIALSINSNSQIVPGLTLAMMLKERTNAHINIGGNFFSRVIDGFKNNAEFFELFAHSLSYEEGEKPTVELAKYVNGEIPVEEVSNLVYLKDGEVVINKKCRPLLLNDTIMNDLSDYKLEKYFAKDIVLPVLSSRGCYWRKCTFCDQDFGQFHNTKNVDKLIDDLLKMKTKYGISHFEFIDESMSVEYLTEFSQKLIDRNADIKWFVNARLENGFTQDKLELAHKAGLQMLLWGFESGSKKVMTDINKGIDIDNRLNILRASHNAGIWNFAFIFFGFPTETKEDALETIDALTQNSDIIDSYGRSVFTMGKHTKLKDNAEKFGITEVYHDGQEFSPTYFYKTSLGMNQKEVNEIVELCTYKCQQAYKNPIWMHLRHREILFLYLSKFGVDYIRNLKIQEV